MKNYKLLLGSAMFAGVCIVSTSLLLDNTAHYSPIKNEQSAKPAYGAMGAMQWLFETRKNQITGELNEADVIAAYKEAADLIKYSANTRGPIGLEWSELGPDNVGGRTRGILVDKNNPNKLFACSIGGGIFVSTNKGSTWTKINDQLSNLTTSCIAQSSNGDIYVGTGEDLYNGFGPGVGPGGMLGGGIYKSTDGGATFTLLSSTLPTTANSVVNTGNEFIGVNNIAVHPNNPTWVYAATRSGLRMSTDGGTTWTLAKGGRAVDVDVATDGTVIACVSDLLYISSDGSAANFTNAGVTGLPAAANVNRIEFAIAPSDPNYMYALAGKSSNGKLEGVYQSTNKGLNWTKIGNGGSTQFEIFGSTAFGQAEYDNSLYVFPNDKTRILAAGVSMWTWKQTNPNVSGVGQWALAASQFQSPFNPYYVHADIHTIKADPSNPNNFWIGCDGGVFAGSINTIPNSTAPFVFQPRNNGYNVTQFYSVAFEGDGKNGTGVLGGTQDNGSNYISGLGNTVREAFEVNGGDGAECEISFLNPAASFTSIYYGDIFRHSSKGGAPQPFYNTRINTASASGSFVTPMALFETKNAVNSVDSIEFINGKQSMIVGTGDGVKKQFSGTLTLPYPAATLFPDSVKVTAGSSLILNDDAAGNFTGNIGTGANNINYATAYYDFTFSSAPALGSPVTVTFYVKYNVGSTFTFNRPQYGSNSLVVTTTSQINPDDTVNFYDPYQSKLAVGFAGTDGVWMTKGCLDFSGIPKWIKLGTISGTAEELAWSADGNILYVGTNNGSLFRFSNINQVKDSITGDVVSAQTVVVKTQIAGFTARTICGLSADPVSNGTLAVTLGNYNNTTYVYYSTIVDTCAQATNASRFTAKQGTGTSKLPNMPVYGVIIEKNDPKRVIVGTEYGAYSTDDITASNPVWFAENGNTGKLPNAPVFKIRQQRRDGTVVNNPYVIYAGTHGRGIWKSSTLIGPVTVGVDEPINNAKANFQSSLLIYPNPMTDIGTVSFDLPQSTSIVISVYNLQGKLVKSINTGKLQEGNQKVNISTDDLSKGTYIISVDGTNVHATSRFVVVK